MFCFIILQSDGMGILQKYIINLCESGVFPKIGFVLPSLTADEENGKLKRSV